MAGRKIFHVNHRVADVAKLERLRKKRNESMTQFAKALGISWRVYQSYVREERKPKPVIMRVAELVERYETPKAK